MRNRNETRQVRVQSNKDKTAEQTLDKLRKELVQLNKELRDKRQQLEQLQNIAKLLNLSSATLAGRSTQYSADLYELEKVFASERGQLIYKNQIEHTNLSKLQKELLTIKELANEVRVGAIQSLTEMTALLADSKQIAREVNILAVNESRKETIKKLCQRGQTQTTLQTLKDQVAATVEKIKNKINIANKNISEGGYIIQSPGVLYAKQQKAIIMMAEVEEQSIISSGNYKAIVSDEKEYDHYQNYYAELVASLKHEMHLYDTTCKARFCRTRATQRDSSRIIIDTFLLEQEQKAEFKLSPQKILDELVKQVDTQTEETKADHLKNRGFPFFTRSNLAMAYEKALKAIPKKVLEEARYRNAQLAIRNGSYGIPLTSYKDKPSLHKIG